jgi:hypothetical protein
MSGHDCEPSTHAIEAPRKPLPAFIRPVLRWVLRRWGRTGRKSERLARLLIQWGPYLTNQPLPARLPNGCRVMCDLKDPIQRQIYFAGLWEPVEAYLFIQLLRPRNDRDRCGGARWTIYAARGNSCGAARGGAQLRTRSPDLCTSERARAKQQFDQRYPGTGGAVARRFNGHPGPHHA